MTTSIRALAQVGVLLIAACGGAQLQPNETRRLSADVYLIAANDMMASCKAQGMCEDFRTPPLAVIADFEKRLPSLLKVKGHGDLAASIPTTYVRQYWAFVGNDGLHIVGNFVCRASAVFLPSLTSDFEPIPPHSLARVPVVVDDAGICLVTVAFPATRPQAAQFVVG